MRVPLVAGLLAICTVAARGGEYELVDLSLEELMEVEVTLAGRKQAPWFEAAAAAAVLTGDDLRRAGVTSVPEALRLLPGMQVAHVDANKWAVSARGFNGRFANKLLVLIDGRSVYTPTFSGVYWEVQDVVLADVERIEVIRGPGATLWGANAVNGVINIVTRSADETPGALLMAAFGDEERGSATVRYGGTTRTGDSWRAYAKLYDRDGFVDADGRATADDARLARVGGRIDGDLGGGAGTLQGDAYDGEAGQTFRFAGLQAPYLRLVDSDTQLRGGNLMGRWQRPLSATSDLALQVYYDRTEREDSLLCEQRDTWDADFQHRLAWRPRQELVWGFGYRYTRNETVGSFAASLSPTSRGENLVSGFAQNETALAAGRVLLTAGTKFEHNDHTGFELQPSLRAWWEVRPRQALWASVARAVRTPSQADDDVRLNLLVSPPDSVFTFDPVVSAAFGDPRMRSETLTAFEIGYRAQPATALLVDLAGFYNRYRDLRGARQGNFFREPEPEPTHLVLPFYNSNGLRGETHGFEAAVDWHLEAARWRLRLAYSYLHMDLRADRTAAMETEDAAGESPEHQLSLWSSADLGAGWQIDGILRYVDGLPAQRIGAYTVADLRLGWQVSAGLELELVARNLLDAHHPEFRAFFVDTLPTETQTEIHAALRWHLTR